MAHDHDDDHEHGSELSEMQLRVRALETVREPRTPPRSSYARATSARKVSSTKVATRSAAGIARERATP